MDVQKHDKTFIVTFALVLGFLGTFTVAIIALANVLDEENDNEEGRVAQLEERLKPAGQVVTDAAMLLAMAPKAEARQAMTPTEVVTKVCNACHGTGVLDAPKVGDAAAWKKRKAAGMDAMVTNAIKGKNAMPPRGGDPSLTDDEVKAAVEEMLKKSGA